MAINPLKIFLFLLGGGAAATATAYVSGVLDPYLYPPTTPPAEVAALPEPSSPADPKTARLPAAEQPAEQPSEPAAPQPGAAAPIVPTFDVVRVEPDGSVVIAGSAAPEALVEVLAQEEVLASSKADAAGAFAIVFDNPLKPGDYQLWLRATDSKKEVVRSVETAVVSIPETSAGEVLAMVEEPGKPAEIITTPQPQPAQPAAPGAAPAADEPKSEVAAAAEEPKAEAASEPQPAAEEAKAEEPQPAAPETADAGSAAAPAEAEAPAAEQPASEQPAAEVAAAEEAAPAGEAEVAAAEPAPAEPAPAAPAVAAPSPTVAVDAVEIEGRKIFVAGTAEAGRTVRVYANADVLGEARAAPNGRFLVEAERDLAVGEYLIRADVLGDDGQVVARAVVPFEREPGESIAAVAPPAPVPAPAPAEEAKPAEVAAAEPQPAPGETAPAESAPAAEPAQAAAPAAESVKPAESGTEPAQPAEPATVAAAPAGEGQVDLPKLETEIAAAPPEEVTAPKLQASQGAVIIRRGDSLWRISRRVYGYGIRYSTIYLANQDQISDPDRIWPGQIFTVPEKTPEGESADLNAIGDQATTKTQ